jgi:macrolide-specific efflux system membrane fusion protein
MSRSKRFWAVGAVILALLGFGAWQLFAADDARVVGGPPTAVVQQGDIEDVVSALGSLQPLNYVDVGSQVSGQLQKIFVELGDNVKQGDQIAQIDPAIYQARVSADEAQLLALLAQVSEQRAQQVLGEQQLKRQQELLAVRATSRDAYDTAAATVKVIAARIDALQAQIMQTESNLKGNQANLSYTKIYAPMSGTVVSVTARQGQTLIASQMAPVILQIADLDTMTVRTQVSEADISKLQVGMTAFFTTLGNPDRRRFGKLRQILPTPTLVNNVVLFDALFDVDNPDRDLMPQMTAQVFFIIASAKNATIVPVAALRSTAPRGGGERKYVVQVMSDGGAIEERPVEVGVITRTQAEIKSGVKAGERLVLAGPAGPMPPAGGPGGGQRPPRMPRL